VSKWRHRFAAQRRDGLAATPMPGAARPVGNDVTEAVLVDTLESAPPSGKAKVSLSCALGER
jgi:hypothetical protein